MKLYAHQQRFIDKNPKRKILVWETGTGKTYAALAWIKKNNIKKFIVTCPKALTTNWNRHLEKEGIEGGIVMSKENFKKYIKNLQTIRDTDEDIEAVIIDEMHYYSGMKSQMSKTLLWYLERNNIDYRLGLTATPYLSTPYNIMMLGKHMGKKWINQFFRWDYPSFTSLFFSRVNMGGRMVPVKKKGIEDDIADLIADIGDVVKLADCADVPDANLQVEYFSLTKQQEKAIKDIQKTDVEFIVRWTKTHQICGGTLKGDEYTDAQTFKSDKMDRLMELVSEIEYPIVVCRYNYEIDVISKNLPKGKKAYIINGKTKDKQAVLDEAYHDEEAVILVNAAVSEGWEFPHSDTIIFYSYDFSLKNYIQMKGRIQRINNIKRCTYISLVVAGTMDEDIYRTITKKKMDFHLKIYENGKNGS